MKVVKQFLLITISCNIFWICGLAQVTNTINKVQEYASSEFEEIPIELFEVEVPLSAAWGDCDNDGYLEILLTAPLPLIDESACQIYKFDGAGSFSHHTSFNISKRWAGASWIEYDRDNNLDIFLYDTYRPGRIAEIYKGDGLIPVFEKTDSIFINMVVTSFKSADFDRDGDMDLILMGEDDNRSKLCKIYWNVENHFSEADIFLKGGECIDIADYNNDNYPDILSAGEDINGNSHTTIYKNMGGTTFQEQKNIILPGIFDASVNWGDYDSDGDPDILITGEDDYYEFMSAIYKNEGNDTFTEQPDINIVSTFSGSADWGDYDNDGDLDILLTGTHVEDTNETTSSIIYKNEGLNIFTRQTTIDLVGISIDPLVDWGDFDADGDLDILIFGNATVKVYRNNILTVNQKPDKPINLQHEITGSQVKLTWSSSNDAETPGQSLTYNARVGSSPGACDIVSPIADINNGTKRIPGEGNSYFNNEFIINNLDTGTYYWSVQSVDNGFLGSDFAEEQSFIVIPAFTKQDGLSLHEVYDGNAYWGDYDNDGDFDILLNGTYFHSGFTYISKIYENEGNQSFVEHADITIDQCKNTSVAWGDYDNDGDLDILKNCDSIDLSDDTIPPQSIIRIVRNEENHSFTELTDITLIGYRYGFAEWVDYDNDGDLDILSAGYERGNAKIYKNNGDGTFMDIQADLNHVRGPITWGDYDNDGDLDMIAGSPYSPIYRNNGDDTFTEINTGLYHDRVSSIDCGDYDNDGDLDILLTGLDDYYKNTTAIYRNDRNDRFTFIDTQLRKIRNGSARWGDYDNDGYLDIGLTGESGNIITKIYHNNQNETFTEISASIDQANNSSFDWGDYDNDGDIDVLLTGYTETGTHQIAGIYNNNTNYPNQPPTAPSNLKSELSGFSMRLSWNKATDPNCSQGSLSYNIRVGSTPEGIDIIAPMANINTGKRNIPAIGNVQCDTFWIIKGIIPNQKYYWSVQSIDQSYTGGPWAPVDSFVITEVSPDFTFDTVCQGNQTVFIDLSETTDTIIAWKWLFGDDSTSVVQNPTHQYQTADTFDVTLWAFTQSGDSASRTRELIVKSAPVAGFLADTVCVGTKTNFTNTSQSIGLTINSWKWDFGDKETSNSKDTVQHFYIADGSYNVQLALACDNGCNNSFSDTVQVGKLPSPVITYSYGGSAICEGDSAIIQAIQIPWPTYTYKWYRNGDLQTNSMNSYTVVNAGEYKVEVTNSIGNCKSESLPNMIAVYERPDTVTIQTVNYDPDACSGSQEVTLIAEPNSELYQYRWYYNDALIAGAYSSQHTDYLKDGIYRVVLGTGQCEVSSQSLNISYKPMLPKPEIYTMGPVVWILACSNDTAAEYKWYYNGTLLPDARKPLYVANKQTGFYHVRISDGGECYISSDTILIGDTNKDAFNKDDETILLYPNPNDGTFNLYYQSKLTGILNIEIYNVLGGLVYSDQFSKNEKPILENINLKGLSPGYYTIMVKMDNSIITRHLIIENN